MKLLFIGDIVGQVGLEYLEKHLPNLKNQYNPDFIVANGENLAENDFGAGLTKQAAERLHHLGVQAITGGNHSWDGSEGSTVHDLEYVLRPLNRGKNWAGRGGLILEQNKLKLGVINIVGRSAIPDVDTPFLAIENQLEAWQDKNLDGILIDFHGESVFEKISIAYAFTGKISALLGTHTHVPTLDTRILEGGVAYVSDVGMTGPSGGAQGYDPASFVQRFCTQGYVKQPMKLATGAVELGAVLVEIVASRATHIQRINAEHP